MTPKEAEKLILEERQKREDEATKLLNEVLEKIREELRCDMDIQTIISSQGLNHRIVFFAK